MVALDIGILRFKKLFAGLKSARNRRALTLGVAPSIEHSRAFSVIDVKTVIDVGANKGQFALFIRQRFPLARIISFEPLKAAADIYRRIFFDDDRSKINNVAIASSDGFAYLFVAKENDASSLLPPSDLAESLFGIAVIETERVRIAPLREFVSTSDIERPALLKLDVQGFELDALRGSVELLPCFDYIYLEVSFLEIYKGQPLANTIIDWLGNHGFSHTGAFNRVIRPKRGEVQADFMFVRRGGEE